MTKTLLVIVSTLVFATQAQAADWYPSSGITQKNSIEFEPLQCPTIGKDYAQMIGQLQSLQDSIKKDANCGQLAKNLQNIGTLTGERRESFLGTIEKVRKGENVSEGEMQSKIIKYAEDITVAAGSLGVMLAEGDQCFGDKDPTTALTALSSFVNEASTLLSSIGGPWGSALAVAGKVSAGFLTGVSKFIEARPGYKFYDKKDWQGYVETLCAFHEQQSAISALIHPEQAIEELNQLNLELQRQLELMESNIPQSSALIQSFNDHDNEGLEKASSEINSATNSNAGVTMVQILTAQRWVNTRMEAIISEANDPLAPSKYLVQKYRDEIEEFMVDRQAPSFVSFQEKETRKALRDLEYFVLSEGSMIYHQIRSFEPQEPLSPEARRNPYNNTLYPSNEDILEKILNADEYAFFDKGELGAQLASSIVYFKRELNQKWDAVNISNGTKKSFCTFFERAGYLNMRLRGACYSSRGKSHDRQIESWQEMGLLKSTPVYLARTPRFKGNTWSETLGHWVDSL